MQKSTAIAHSNIALVKYWGKGDEKLRLPVNSSAAIALDNLTTTTTVEFREDLNADEVELLGDGFESGEVEKVSKHLDRVREMAGIKLKAKVVSKTGIMNAVKILFFLFFVGVIIYLYKNRNLLLNLTQKILLYFFLFCFFINWFMLIFTLCTESSRYRNSHRGVFLRSKLK